MSVVAKAEADALEEDVFQEEVGLLSPLPPEGLDLPDIPVSLH